MGPSKHPNIKKRVSERATIQRSSTEEVKTTTAAGSDKSYTSETVASENPNVNANSEELSSQKTSNVDSQNTLAEQVSASTEPYGSADTSSSTVSASIDQIPSVIEVGSLNRQKDDDTIKDTLVQNEILKNILSPQTGKTAAANKTNKSQPLGKGESAIFCRICHEIGSTDLFISPCDCKGSLSVVHKRCLERWLAESNSNFCELCGFEYNVMRLAKRNVVTSMFWWVVSSNNARARRLLAFDLISLSVLIPLAFLGTTLGMKAVAQELPNMTVLALSYTRFLQLALMAFALTLDIGILTWTMIRLQYHFFKWLEWHRKNCNVHLLGYPEPQTAPTIPVPHVSSATLREIKF